MKKGKAKVFLTLLVILIAGIYYYVTIPAVNIHASGFWTFILTVIVLLLAAYGIKMRFTSFQEAKRSKVFRIGGISVCSTGDCFCSGKLFYPHQIVNAKKYRNLLTIEERDFQKISSR